MQANNNQGVQSRVNFFEQLSVQKSLHVQTKGLIKGHSVTPQTTSKIPANVVNQHQAKPLSAEQKAAFKARITKASPEMKAQLGHLVDDILSGIKNDSNLLTTPLKVEDRGTSETQSIQTHLPLTMKDEGTSTEKLSVRSQISTASRQGAELQKLSNEELFTLIGKNREGIASNVKSVKEQIDKSGPDPMRDKITKIMSLGGNVSAPIKGGIGGARILADPRTGEKFLLKANDEDAYCLNNPKKNCFIRDPTANFGGRVRDGIPIGNEAETSYLAFKVAEMLGMPSITPQTTMAIIESPHFHDIMDSTVDRHDPEAKLSGDPVKTKACSIQQFVENSQSFLDKESELDANVDTKFDTLQAYAHQNFDFKSFTNAYLYSAVLGENDGNLDNLRIKNNKIIKIDNGLTFPESNADFSTSLSFFDHETDDKASLVETPFTDKQRQMIGNLPEGEIADKMRLLGKTDLAVTAFHQRVVVLKHAVEKFPDASIADVDDMMKIFKNKAYSVKWSDAEILEKIDGKPQPLSAAAAGPSSGSVIQEEEEGPFYGTTINEGPSSGTTIQDDGPSYGTSMQDPDYEEEAGPSYGTSIQDPDYVEPKVEGPSRVSINQPARTTLRNGRS